MLKIDIEPIKGILFVRLSGTLSKKTINKLGKEVINLQKKTGIKNIVLNIDQLDYIDNYGKNALTKSIKICKHNNGQAFICSNKNINIKDTKIINDELTALNLIKL